MSAENIILLVITRATTAIKSAHLATTECVSIRNDCMHCSSMLCYLFHFSVFETLSSHYLVVYMGGVLCTSK